MPIPLAVVEVSPIMKKRLPWVLMGAAFVLILVVILGHLVR